MCECECVLCQIFDLGLVCERCVSILQCGFCVNLCVGVNVLCLCVLCDVCIDACVSKVQAVCSVYNYVLMCMLSVVCMFCCVCICL